MGRNVNQSATYRPIGRLSLTFDNLGEAAEIEMGAWPPDARLGEHPTATEVVPALLDRLDAHGLAATFFVEGLNAELYPELLREIDRRGHEVAYHAWRHEQWGELDEMAQIENLVRGLTAFASIGLELRGLRPPGGQLGSGGTSLLRDATVSYCSPAGTGAGIEDGVVLLPFQWRHLDASCVLPPLAPAREQLTGSTDPVAPEAFVAALEVEIERLGADGGYMAIVLHPFMLEWLRPSNLERLLGQIAALAGDGRIEVLRCADAAARVRAEPRRFEGGTALDSTSWA